MKILSRLLPLVLILALIFPSISWWRSAQNPPSSDTTSYPFVIEPGQNATSIGRELQQKGFIRSELAFRIYLQLRSLSGKIQAGDYRLEKNKSLSELISKLIRGPIALWVTLPEGLRREEVAQKIADTLDLSKENKQQFINNFLKETEDKEGYLFPDTYLFLRNSKLETIIEKLTDTFEKKVKENVTKNGAPAEITLKDVILASIVERETKTNEERPIVAGILLKRIEIGMPLQTDATIQYAIANERCKSGTNGIKSEKCSWWEPITLDDRSIKSPYNTYTNRGLPPGPIANPGLSSLKAVVNPEKSSYLYYLHGKDGKIHYAKTIEEHGENIRKYL